MIQNNQEQNWWESYETSPTQPQSEWWSEYEIPEKETTFEERLPMAAKMREANLYQSGSELASEGFVGGEGFMEQRYQRDLLEQEKRQQTATEASNLIGAPVDPSQTFEQGAKDYLLSWDMSRNKNFEDIQSKFLKTYPEGQIRSVPTETGGTITVARRSINEPFRELSPGWENFSDFFLNETALLGAIGTFGGPVGTFVGTTGGSILQRAIESSRGYEQGQDVSTDVTLALLEGTIAGGIDAATRRVFSLSGVSPINPNASKLLSAQDRLSKQAMQEFEIKFPELVSGQVGGPFKTGIFLQVAATSPRVQATIGKQQEALYDWFVANLDSIPAGGMSDETLGLVAGRYRTQIEQIDSYGDVNRPAVGRLIERGVFAWKESTEVLRNRSYAAAGELSEGVSFDLSSAQSSVRELRQGVFGRGRPIQEEAAVVGPQGEPLFVETVPDIRLPEGQSRELNQIMQAISELDPTVSGYVSRGGVESTSLEQIARLRTRLFDLKNAPELDADIYRAANRLWSDLTNIMDAPVGGSPEFVQAYQAARQIHRNMEDVLKQTTVLKVVRNRLQNPEEIGKKYAMPGHFTELQFMKDLFKDQPDIWNGVREHIINDLVNGSTTPRRALARLEAFRAGDRQSLRLLLSESEEANIEKVLNARLQMESQPFMRSMQKFSFEAERAGYVFERSTPEQLAEQISQSGGIDSEFAVALRGHVYRKLFNSSRQRGADSEIDAGKLVSNLNVLKETGKLDSIFSRKDYQILTDLELIAQPISETGDIGGGMMAGAARQKGIESFGDIAMGKAGKVVGLGHQLLSNDIAAYLLSRPAFRKAYEPMPKTLEEKFRRTVLYFQIALRDSYPEEEQFEESFLERQYP